MAVEEDILEDNPELDSLVGEVDSLVGEVDSLVGEVDSPDLDHTEGDTPDLDHTEEELRKEKTDC